MLVCFNATIYLCSYICKNAHESTKEKSARITISHAQSVLNQISSPISPLEFVSLLHDDLVSSHVNLENDAFTRLYRGYVG